MTQIVPSAHRPGVLSQEALRSPPRTYHPKSPQNQHQTPYPLAWSEYNRTSRRTPGSISSDDTASTSWSTQKPYQIPASSARITYPSPPVLVPSPPQGYMQDLSYRDGQSQQATVPTPYPAVMSHTPSTNGGDNSAIHQYIREHEEARRKDDHAFAVMLWLSVLDPFYCTFASAYSLVALLFHTALSPFHLCSPKSKTTSTDSRTNDTFSLRLTHTLSPVYRAHLRYMHATSIKRIHNDNLDLKPKSLVFVHVVSPFLSIGVAIAAWIAALFWFFELIMSDTSSPGSAGVEDDGRHYVLMVRNWWEKFHLLALRNGSQLRRRLDDQDLDEET